MARAFCKKGIEIFAENGDEAGEARGYLYLGEIYRLIGNDKGAKEAYEQCLKINRRIGNLREIGAPPSNLSYIAMHQNDFELAEELAREGLKIEVELMSKYYIAIGLAMVAGPVATQKRPERAAVLFGASNGILKDLEACHQPSDQVEFDRYMQNILSQIDETAYENALAKGESMSLEEAIAFAFEE